MSLGPPFDDSGEKQQLLLGSGVLVALAITVLGILAFSGRTLGRGAHINVRMHIPGALREQAKVRLAGRDIGEIRSIVPNPKDGGVICDAFILSDWLPHLHERSELFVSSVSILGEAHLEVGPPRDGGDPGPSIKAGANMTATDPPDLDNLLRYSLDNSQKWMALLEDVRPDLSQLMTAGASLMKTIDALPVNNWGQIVDRMFEIFRGVRALSLELDSIGGGKRVMADARDIGTLIDDKSPEIGRLLDQFSATTEKLRALEALLTDEQKQKAVHAWNAISSSGASASAIATDVKWLVDRVKHGKGTLGGFLTDKELWDDLHESHRKIKSQPWTLVKPPKR